MSLVSVVLGPLGPSEPQLGEPAVEIRDLEAFQDVPFLCWVKDEDWRYLWGNRAICDLAGENVIGKKDSELVWKANAEALVRNDEDVLASGKVHFIHEKVDHSEHGTASLSVCKWVDELDGRRLVFGISFVIPG
jgi:PAS domain-containing protein